MWVAKRLFCLLVLLAHVMPASPINVAANFDTIEPFMYVGRFVFTQNRALSGSNNNASCLSANDAASAIQRGGGLVNYTLTIPTDSQLQLLVYSDYAAWTRIAANSKTTCTTALQNALISISLSSGQPIFASSASNPTTKYCTRTITGSSSNSAAGSTKVQGLVAFTFTSPRPEWGILVLANCDAGSTPAQQSCFGRDDCQGPVIASGRFVLTNGDSFSGKFSYDEQGVFWALLLFFLAQCLVLSLALHTRSALLRTSKYHPTVKLLVASCALQLVALLFGLLYWLNAGTSGNKVQGLWVFASFCTALANYCVIIMLILLGKGLSLIRRTLSASGSLKLVAYATSLFLCIVFAEAFALFDARTSSGVYFYATPPGVLLLCLRCLFATPWFLITSLNMARTFEQKKRFFRKFTWLFTAWLAAPALFTLISISINEMARTTFGCVWENGLVLVAHTALLLLYDPLFACINTSYPFHQNTDVGSDDIFYPTFAVDASASPRNSRLPPPAPSLTSQTLREANATRGVNIQELFREIRDNSLGVRETLRTLAKMGQQFSDRLEDWLSDVQREDDEDE